VIPFDESFAAWVASTAIPAFVGLLVITLAGRRLGSRLAAGFALGIFLWFFVDTIEGSADLDVSAGYGGGVAQLAMVLLFLAGLLIFFSLDRGMFSSTEGIADRGLFILLLAAVAIGIHGFGEGTAFGSTAYSTPVTSLLGAFGGVSGGAAYALHKMFEPMMVGALYVAYSNARPRSMGGSLRDLILLTLVFVLPSFVGAFTGYFISYDATYFFALGTGTSIFTAFLLGKQAFRMAESSQGLESLKMSAALALGFILIYLAALLHS
jgi:hypothetical protein